VYERAGFGRKSTCLQTTVYAATAAYNCPSGGSLSGSTCAQTSSYTATSTYGCNAGDSLNGSTCTHSSASAATPSYSCPDGATLSGSQCVGATSNRTDPIYLDGKQIAETVVGAATQYFHADALGSPVERSLSTGAGSISFLPVAEGVSGGFFAHPNEGYEVKLGNGDSPLTFKGGGEVKGGFILVGGVEAEVDPAGTLTSHRRLASVVVNQLSTALQLRFLNGKRSEMKNK
jgi:hypothetical protein